MPLHLDAFVLEDTAERIYDFLLEDAQTAEPVYISKDKTVAHLRKRLKDDLSGREFGSVIYTIKMDREEDTISIIDIDIVPDSVRSTTLTFMEKLPSSSEANEYYNAEVTGKICQIQVETVNRNACDEEIVDTDRDVFLSAFPFSVNMFNSMDEVNERFKAKGKKEVGDTGLEIGGFADEFAAPSTFFTAGKDSDETFTYFFGRVSTIRSVKCSDLGEKVSFLLVYVDCAMGLIPVVMSQNCFDLEDLDLGKILEIRADIKADFSTYPPKEKVELI